MTFGMMAMTPRYLSALQAKGSNQALSALETAHQVPRAALLVTVALVGVLLSVSVLGRLFVLSSVAVLFQYSVSVLSLARLGFRRAHGISLRDAWPAPLALLALGLVASAVQSAELYVLAGIVALAVLLWFARKHLP